MIDVFPSEFQTPRQTLHNAEIEVDDMEHMAIIYIRKGEHNPRLTCSSMLPTDLNFLAVAAQHYSMQQMLNQED